MEQITANSHQEGMFDAVKYRHQSLDTQEPDHIDSFSDKAPLASGRRLAWTKLLEHQISSSTKKRPLSYKGEYDSSHGGILSQNMYSHERWPNGPGSLQNVQPIFVEKGPNKVFVHWSLSKQKKWDTLPQYYQLVRTKELHPRGSVAEEDDELHRQGLLRNTAGRFSATDLARRNYKKGAYSIGINALVSSHVGNNTTSLGANSDDTWAPSSTEAESTSLSGATKQTGPTAGSLSDDKRSSQSEIQNSGAGHSVNGQSFGNAPATPNDLTANKSKVMATSTKDRSHRNKKQRRPGKEWVKGDESPPEQAALTGDQEQTIPDTPMEEPPTTPNASDLDVANVAVPDLPAILTNAEARNKMRRGAGKRQLNISTDARKPVAQPLQTPEDPALTLYDFSLLESANLGVDHLTGYDLQSHGNNILLPPQNNRFELPVDLKKLEKLSPQEYLSKYCRMSLLSRKMCMKTFYRYREKTGHIQGKSNLHKALKDVLISSITEEQGEELCALMEIKDNTSVDFPLFVGVTAMTERILEATNHEGCHKERVEHADFHSLSWKLLGLDISDQLRIVLRNLS